MMCFKFTLPINIKSKAMPPMSKEVERLAGAINTQIIPTGIINGKNPFLKSLITFCLLLNSRLIYINKASLARSEVWKVRLITGSLIQRLASLIWLPYNNVYNKSGTEITNRIDDTRE